MHPIHVNRSCPAATNPAQSTILICIFSDPCSCGQETRVIPRILQLRSHWLKSEKESLRLQEAGITKEVMNSAIAQFCLEIIAKHGEPAPRLCNKDPLTLKMGSYVIELFPNVSTRSDTISPFLYILPSNNPHTERMKSITISVMQCHFHLPYLIQNHLLGCHRNPFQRK